MRSLWTGLFTDTFLCSVQKQKTNKLVLQTSLHTSYEKPKKLTKADCGKPEAARRAEKEPQDRDDPRIRKVPQGAARCRPLGRPRSASGALVALGFSPLERLLLLKRWLFFASLGCWPHPLAPAPREPGHLATAAMKTCCRKKQLCSTIRLQQ